MTKKRFINYADLHGQVLELANAVQRSGWKPDYVVGLTRGGLLPAVMLSHWFDVPCETLKVSLRDGGQCESNAWMADDAYGYVQPIGEGGLNTSAEMRRNILIVDDINDSGDTIEWIRNDWQRSCSPNSDAWESIWHGNVRFAVLVNNAASKADVDYCATQVNKHDDDVWLVFPWENWWVTENVY